MALPDTTVIGAVDETFLQHMMLVFMDLATGYLLMEEVATDRSFDTWYGRGNDHLTTFGTEVLYMVNRTRRRDADGSWHIRVLAAQTIADLFHLGYDLAKGYSLCIFGSLRHAKRDLERAKAAPGDGCRRLHRETIATSRQAQARVVECTTSVDTLKRCTVSGGSSVQCVAPPASLAT